MERANPSPESPRRSRSSSSSPEFEFWMVNNPSFPQPNLLSADELFVDGVLLPLHLLNHPNQPEHEPEPAPDPPQPPPASISSSAPSSGSKRWKDLFKVGERKPEEKKRSKDRKGSAGGSAELNINIWPFSRSRSAGNAGAAGRPKAAAARKVSSAPCSRSNSRGESSKPPPSAGSVGRRWAASPGRTGLSGGVHLGRTSPVWQIRRTGKGTEPAGRVGPRENKGVGALGGKKGGGVRVLNLNVNTCIGYRTQMSCRGEDKDRFTAGDRTGDGGGRLFGFRALFSKKVY